LSLLFICFNILVINIEKKVNAYLFYNLNESNKRTLKQCKRYAHGKRTRCIHLFISWSRSYLTNWIVIQATYCGFHVTIVFLQFVILKKKYWVFRLKKNVLK